MYQQVDNYKLHVWPNISKQILNNPKLIFVMNTREAG
jgi:hypothetical protein